NQPVAQGVRLGFGRPDGNIRRDARQDLVAGDEEAVRLAPETDVFGTVALSDHHPPGLAPQHQNLIFDQTTIATREGLDRSPKAAVAVAPAADLFVIPACGAIEA